MSLKDVSVVGNIVYVTVVLTKADGQSGTPTSVGATITLAHEKTLITPAPTATVVMNAGVATITFSWQVTRNNLLAGVWYFGVVTTGDLIAAYDSCVYITSAPVLNAV